MSSATAYPPEERLAGGDRAIFNLYIVTSLLVFVLMMLLGLVMRLAQGTWLDIPADLFYQIMTAHGAAMVGTTALATSAVMWFFLRKYVRLSTAIFAANYVLFLLGAVLILGAIFLGNYGGAWTFLYPLPVSSQNAWGNGAAVAFMAGYLAIGVGFLLFYLDTMRAVIRRYGNLGRALGLQWLFGGEIDKSHPKTVVASTMVMITNSIGTLVGAIALVMSIINAYYPAWMPDALLIKNFIYLFGHMFINATIYMAVIAVYELLPRYSGRYWPISRAFLWAWAITVLMVLSVYPHHLLMDYVMPRWMLVMGQVVSYTSGVPVFVITAYGALANVHRSGMRWNLPSKLIMLSMFGWSAGIVPAIVDATIRVNQVMHNTLWVPGHFHFYILLGVVPMCLALMFHVIDSRASASHGSLSNTFGFPAFLLGGLVFVMAFLAGGYISTPRRFAVHLPEWVTYDQWASIAAMVVIAAMLLFTVRIVFGLLKPAGDVDAAHISR
ncbi:MAG: cbb3-type cytochrome c oxidase subunit I [Acetobacteraceae bacterium]|nr:cbb3-type cytochrome c oxidase subunit I [Acetobacteraceae bacterium]